MATYRAQVLRSALACVAAALIVSIVGAAGPARAVDVVGDDGADRYTGSGGLILPASIAQDTRQSVAQCRECRWRLVAPCIHRPDEGAQVACMAMVSGCPAGETRLRAWLSRDGGSSWIDVGLVCLGADGPVTVQAVDVALHDAFVRSLPAGSISVQPPTGVLPYLPVVLDSGQPASIGPSSHHILGRAVVLSPRPRWHWTFGDGAELDTALPGSHYPDLQVAHTYRRGGPMEISVTTTWTADFLVDGLGPFAVSEPVHQRFTTIIEVGQARATLVP